MIEMNEKLKYTIFKRIPFQRVSTESFDRIVRIVFGVFFLSLPVLALFGPLIQSLLEYPSGEGIYKLLSHICHQYPTRSFWITNRPMALCSRCFGGYLGLSLFLIFKSVYQYPYIKRLTMGVFLLIPGVADGYLQLTTDYESVNILRFITGFSGGVGAYIIFYPIIRFKNNTKEEKYENH